MSDTLPNHEYALTAKQLRDLADIAEALENKAQRCEMLVNLSGDIECEVTITYDGTGTFGVVAIEGAGA